MKILVTAIAILSLAPAAASAYEMSTPIETSNAPMISVQVGGGVNDFVTKSFDKATDTGAAWDVRGILGLPIGVGLEAAYVGSVNPFKNSGSDGANLLRNGGEALLRANLMPLLGADAHFLSRTVAIQPYLAAGVGGSEMRVVDDNGNSITASNGATFEKGKTSVNVPGAVGVDAFIGKRVGIGARGSYRYDFDNRISPTATKEDIQSWQATARLGVAF